MEKSWGQLKKMLNVFEYTKKSLFILIIVVMLDTSFSLTFPFLIKKFIDGLDITELSVQNLVVIGIFFITKLAISALLYILICNFSEKIVSKLRIKILSNVVRSSISEIGQFQAGDISSIAINDTEIISSFISSRLIGFFSSIISICATVVILIALDWKIAIIMMILVPGTLFFTAILGGKEFKISKKYREETASLSNKIIYMYHNIKMIKSYTREEKEILNSKKNINDIKDLGIKEGRLNALIQPISNSLVILLIAVVFGYGIYRVSTNSMSAGTLVAIIMYLFQITDPFAEIMTIGTEYQKFLTVMERVQRLLNLKIEETYEYCNNQNLPSLLNSELQFKNLSFSYNENSKIIKSLNIKFKEGEVTALVGESGIGKTTIFSLIERFYEPDSGCIEFNSTNIKKISLEEWRKNVAYVSQDNEMVKGTILDNLIYGCENHSFAQVESVIDSVGLKDFVNALPEKYNTDVGSQGSSISGGQKQRLSIARALLKKPKIIIMDEVTSNLDAHSEQVINQTLRDISKDKIVIIIAHRQTTIEKADRIIVMDNQGLRDLNYLSYENVPLEKNKKKIVNI